MPQGQGLLLALQSASTAGAVLRICRQHRFWRFVYDFMIGAQVQARTAQYSRTSSGSADVPSALFFASRYRAVQQLHHPEPIGASRGLSGVDISRVAILNRFCSPRYFRSGIPERNVHVVRSWDAAFRCMLPPSSRPKQDCSSVLPASMSNLVGINRTGRPVVPSRYRTGQLSLPCPCPLARS